MMNIGIMPHTRKPVALELAKELVSFLTNRDVHVWMEASSASLIGHPEKAGPMSELENLDVLIVLGGDGALLNAARLVSNYHVPLLGVNVGHLGFLTELETEDVSQAMEHLLAGNFCVEERMFLDGRVIRDGVEVANYRALNDMVINRGTFARIIRLQIFVDDQHVIDYIADGIIVATPTGSTAYSLSAGGPIIEPLLESITITPICPHTLAARSFVVRPKVKVRLEIDAAHEDVMLTVDGQLGFRLQSQDSVVVEQAPVMAKFVKLSGRSFFEILHRRLKTPQN